MKKLITVLGALIVLTSICVAFVGCGSVDKVTPDPYISYDDPNEITIVMLLTDNEAQYLPALIYALENNARLDGIYVDEEERSGSSPATWVHTILTADSDSIKIYSNGQLTHSEGIRLSINKEDQTFRINRNDYPLDLIYADGMLGDVEITYETVTEQDALQIYQTFAE